jgi:predicted DNA-binding protein
MQKIDGRRLAVIIPNEMLKRLDRVAKRQEMTRVQVMRNMMDVGLSVYEDFESVGVVRLVEVFERTKKGIRKEVGQLRLIDG